LFFAFLGGSPHVVVTLMGRSAFELGLWFATASFAYLLGNYCSARFSMRFGVDAMIAAGAAVGLVGGVAMVVLVLAFPHAGPIIIFLPQWITAFANGLLMPNAIAGAISVRPHAAGTASGIHGFVQMMVGAAGAQWVSHLLVDASTAAPMAWVLLAFAVACALSFAALVRRPPAQPREPK
jgi:DHA1 family bicyclomycin/chloramphenicol resistance-like MFS transporter